MLNWFARKIQELQKAKREEQGFTLIELLVVVIIIGILAAIAIPVFLSQRDRANRSALESDVRNLSAAATSCAAAFNGSYAGACDTLGPITGANNDLRDFGYNPSQNVNITDAMIDGTANGWSVTGATHTNLTGVTASFSTTGANAGRVTVSP